MLFFVLLEFDKDFFLFSIICHLLGHGALCGVTRGGWVCNYACALGDSLVHQQWHTSKSWKMKSDFLLDVYTILNRI